MRRIQVIDERLYRWGCWCTAGGQLHSEGVSSCYAGERSISASDNKWSPRVPFDNLEAEQTNRAVTRLDDDQRRVVHAVYVKGFGGTIEQHARSLRVSKATVQRWLCLADEALVRILDEDTTARRRQAA